MRIFVGISVFAGALVLMAAPEAKTATVKGYVIDSACTFTKNLKKPISPDCAKACAKAGSPLVILGDDGAIYWPTTDAMPATSQNDKLVPFICILSPAICYFLNMYSAKLLGGYVFFNELIIVNGLITFVGLLVTSKRKTEAAKF